MLTFLPSPARATLFLAALTFGSGRVPGQEVFREVTYTYGAPRTTHFAELDPDTKRVFTGEHDWIDLPQSAGTEAATPNAPGEP